MPPSRPRGSDSIEESEGQVLEPSVPPARE